MKKKTVKAVSQCVKKLLGLDTRRAYYSFPTTEAGAYATCDQPASGNTFYISYYPTFFEQPDWHQLSIIVHEHIHAMMTPLTQVWATFKDEMPEPQRSLFTKSNLLADETFVCEMESVLYNLVKNDSKIKRIMKGK